MPPKKVAAATSTSVYLVVSGSTISSVHASQASAEAAKKDDAKIEVQTLIGGTISVDPVAEEKKPAKAKAAKTEDAPKANTAAKKTKTPAEQRAANVDKPKKGQPADKDLPENVRSLLNGKGNQLKGMAIIVTGVPPVMGRANTEKLVVLYGGKVSKSLSKNTSLVVIGNEAGPTKLEKIEDLGLKTVDEDGLVALLEGGAGSKHALDDEDDEDEDEEEEEEEEEKPKKGKKQKK
ncbi:uncharacterized protein LY89DRAFT_689709 [Mollisia scopiformis]|uniref:BRCT domain-containing protein n=1 Tax=Mollisia scopiformis TaxID=149040 RepID=A0A132BFI8_MOLSC|nr:uncharacterized protein LY89DRAFT_689709 [Mollisia scopiformis]KUJ10477.1 hypothetical protein LY89DRAFT_689709 [Mollisia scopiformis]